MAAILGHKCGAGFFSPAGCRRYAERQGGEQDSDQRAKEPMRVIGHRAAEGEFRSLGRAVENTPVAPGRAFERALPGLVEGLDDVDPEILALAERKSLFDGPGLVRR